MNAREKSKFIGWSTSDNSRNYTKTDNPATVSVTAATKDGNTNTVNYYAVFDHVYSQAIAGVANGGGGKIYVAQTDMSLEQVPDWYDNDQTAVVNLVKKTYYWYAKANTGYSFSGWLPSQTGTDYVSTNAKYSEEITAESTSNTDPTKKNYYAKFTINRHTLTWDFAGGSTSSTTYTKAGTYDYKTAITYPANNTMSRAGYTFNGWDKTITNMPDENVTITAQWTAHTNTPYKVEHYFQDINGNYPAEPTQTQVLYGTTDTKVTPNYYGDYTGYTAPDKQTVNIAIRRTKDERNWY